MNKNQRSVTFQIWLRLLTLLFLFHSCDGGGNSGIGSDHSEFNPSYPRLMGINFGGSYSDPDYQKAVSKYNVIVTSFYPEWNKPGNRLADTLSAIKKNNPDILIFNYAIFNDVSKGTNVAMNADILKKVNEEDWWLRNSNGDQVQIAGNSWNYWTINVTEWATKDKQGLRFPEWRAQRDNEIFFSKLEDFDGWYVDITDYKPTSALADYKRNGTDAANTDPAVNSSYRKAQAAGWARMNSLQPNRLVIGNIDHTIDDTTPEFKNKLNGAFMESLTGETWSLISYDWNKGMERYHTTMKNVLAPKIVGFGFRGSPTDYQNMRYGLTSCLMDDGYYSYSNISTGYTEALWFDEYDAKLGQPTDPVQTKTWKSGIYRRNFDNGTALVNPTSAPVTVSIESGYKHITGTQDPVVNDGQPVTSITISAKDGVILLKD